MQWYKSIVIIFDNVSIRRVKLVLKGFLLSGISNSIFQAYKNQSEGVLLYFFSWYKIIIRYLWMYFDWLWKLIKKKSCSINCIKANLPRELEMCYYPNICLVNIILTINSKSGVIPAPLTFRTSI